MNAMTTRRDFLLRSGLIGCSLAASPLVTPVSLAAAPGENRFVVIILRGGMDALDVVRPYGDPDYAGLRPLLEGGPQDGAIDLDGFYAAHPALSALTDFWRRGDLGFVQAVSTPYRDKRSHFDGQDLLEAGTQTLGQGSRDGWLNRMMQVVPGVTARTAYAIGRGDLKILKGVAPVSNWAPETDLPLSPQALRLMELVTESDPAIHAALNEARLLSDDARDTLAIPGGLDPVRKSSRGYAAIARFAARQLADEARIAAFSINGWDTHRAQDRALPRALLGLVEALQTLHDALPDPVWDKTAVVALTEFGRTVRENGTRGTDHGTGGLMLLAGGAVRGGRVHGLWPGLAESDLYDRRDLMPTRDVRDHVAWIMRGLFGLGRADLEGSIFPGLQLEPDPNILL